MRNAVMFVCLLALCACSSPSKTKAHYDAKLVSVTAEGNDAKPYISWQSEGQDALGVFPGNLQGWIVLNGTKCEQFRPGYRRQHLVNAYGRGEYGVDIKRGASVEVYLMSFDGKKRTNPVKFVWPWKSTR